MNGLMIAFAFTLPYHVMRAAAAAGVRVHVLGGSAARGLRRSRYCRSFHKSNCGGAEALFAEITGLARREAIDAVFPSDDVSTRMLVRLADRLPVRCIAVPDPATFDRLNDKADFTAFCRKNGIRAPEFWLFDSADALRAAIGSGEVALPLTVKPTDRSGGRGVIHVREREELGLIGLIDYRPVLAQRHIRGESVSITLMCERGRMTAHVAQQRDSRQFRVLAIADLLDQASRLAALTGYSGTVNFDAVVADDDGFAYLVECNPRFWYSIYLVMIAGLNFVQLALASPSAEPATLADGEFRLSLHRILARPWRASRLDWRYITYCLADPFAFAMMRGRAYDDSAAAARPAPIIGAAATARDLGDRRQLAVGGRS
jgi:biotin carboxylase